MGAQCGNADDVCGFCKYSPTMLLPCIRLEFVLRQLFMEVHMKTRLALASFGVFVLFAAQNAKADYFQYNIICIPTQVNHVQRVLQGRIYLALKTDRSIAKSAVTVSVRKGPEVIEKKREDELLEGLGYFFDTRDLSLSLGGNATGHACYADGTATVKVSVTRKNGTVASNQFTTHVQLPGAYATKAKVRVSEVQ
jgi:hypothetical protein